MSEPTAEEYLIRGLAKPHENLYFTNAWFKTALDQFAAMLPLMVNGFAAEAGERQAAMDKAMRAAETAMLADLPVSEGGDDE